MVHKGAKGRRSETGVFVAINFCDLLLIQWIASIFEFRVVAVNRLATRAGTAARAFFAYRESTREYYSTTGTRPGGSPIRVDP
jgi:hypothetical protein